MVGLCALKFNGGTTNLEMAHSCGTKSLLPEIQKRKQKSKRNRKSCVHEFEMKHLLSSATTISIRKRKTVFIYSIWVYYFDGCNIKHCIPLCLLCCVYVRLTAIEQIYSRNYATLNRQTIAIACDGLCWFFSFLSFFSRFQKVKKI